MGYNPHLIPPRTRDPGAAHSLRDLHRRLQKLESSYGVVGSGATVTGFTITTSDSGARVVIQSSKATGDAVIPAQQAGIFITDPTNSYISVSILPNSGITIQVDSTGTINPWNSVTWKNGSSLVATIGVQPVPDQESNEFLVYAVGPRGALVNLVISAGDSYQTDYVSVSTNVTNETFISDGLGNGSWQGSISATAFNHVSDEKLKCEVKPIEGSPIEALVKLRPITYKLSGKGHEIQHGFVAQEVLEHIPQVVKERTIRRGKDKDFEKELAIDMMGMISLMVGAIQELQTRLTELEKHG